MMAVRRAPGCVYESVGVQQDDPDGQRRRLGPGAGLRHGAAEPVHASYEAVHRKRKLHGLEKESIPAAPAGTVHRVYRSVSAGALWNAGRRIGRRCLDRAVSYRRTLPFAVVLLVFSIPS